MRRLIKVDGTTQDFDTPQTLEQIRNLIGADTLDTVTLRHMGPPLQIMAVDDGGHGAHRPVNPEATKLYHRNCVPGVTHQIVGDVFISPDDDFA